MGINPFSYVFELVNSPKMGDEWLEQQDVVITYIGEDTFQMRIYENRGKIKEGETAMYLVKAGKKVTGVKNRVEIGGGEYELLEMSLEESMPNQTLRINSQLKYLQVQYQVDEKNNCEPLLAPYLTGHFLIAMSCSSAFLFVSLYIFSVPRRRLSFFQRLPPFMFFLMIFKSLLAIYGLSLCPWTD
jgi:hypothetical protein